MDLRSHLLELIAPITVGDELVPGARLIGASTELGLRLIFDLGGTEIRVEVEPAAPGRRYAAKTERLLFSYRSSGGNSELGLRLCQRVAALAAKREALVLAAIAEDAAAAREREENAARVREVRIERLLEPAGTPSRRHHTLTPYVGCLVGCRFCYAQSRTSLVRRLEELPELPWGSYVDVRVNAAEVLAEELEELPALPIKFCPIVSDPYQAVESRYRITRACLEVLLRARFSRSVLVLTRARLIERDINLLSALEQAYVGASIPTIDDEVRRHFEPRAAAIGERVAMLYRMREAGVRTFAVVQPLLPGPIEALADALAGCVTSVSIDVLHDTFGAARDFEDPRYRMSADPRWQWERAEELIAALTKRGVEIWQGELPPELQASGS